jgi:hypothetical protein
MFGIARCAIIRAMEEKAYELKPAAVRKGCPCVRGDSVMATQAFKSGP